VRGPFVFFDLGQTLVDEWEFINYFDTRFHEILNGFGARIDLRNYRSLRDSVIRDRKIGNGSVLELVAEVCRLVSPPGYEKAIASRIRPEIEEGRRLFKFSKDSEAVLTALDTMEIEMGLIANQSRDIMDLLEKSGLRKFFKVIAISSVVGISKPDPGIFQHALIQAGRTAGDSIMVGDRLDTDICPAKTIGMTTIRYTNSLFALQEPQKECERAAYTVVRLTEIPYLVKRIVSGQSESNRSLGFDA
jgi:HAD superfamily hydrolase (TIGR01549 family)